jgi:hypothetical protein
MKTTREIAVRITNQVAIGCWRYQSEGWLIDAIDQALRQHEIEVRAEAWQPIETAPKDGTRVWLFGTALTFDDYERPNAMVIGMWLSDKWRVVASGQPREMEIKANYWQPLPDPPAIRRDSEAQEREIKC